MNKFKFKKKYGQNFLKDNNIINKINDSINTKPDDLIIEIGPGGGALTKKLLKKGSQLIAFEIDEDAHMYLDKLVSEKTTIVYEDILTTNLPKHLSNYNYDKLYIVGNLPYYITTAILEKIIKSNINPESITIMVQKEVAQRFTAKPHNKEYGYMTVLLNYFYNIKKVCDVSRLCFYPIPDVDSAVIQLIKKNNKADVSFLEFDSFIKEAFRFKRKKLINNIQSIDKEKVLEVLTKRGYTSEARAEEIDLETFIELLKKKGDLCETERY